MGTNGRKPVCDADRLRERMSRAGVDIILASSKRNVGWLTDHQTENWTWEHAILHMMEKEYDGEDYLVFAGFPLDPSLGTYLVEYAHREDAIRQRGVFADGFYGYWHQGREPQISGPGLCLEQGFTRSSVEAAVQGILDRGLEAATVGIEMSRISAAVLARLRELLPQAKFVDVFELLFDARQIKSAEEIRRLRHAYNVASDVYRSVFSTVHAGMTPREILLHENSIIYDRGCSFSFAHIFFGSGGQDIAYTPPPDRKIQPGDIGVFDLGVVYEGYGTDYARMAHVLPGNSSLVEIFPIVVRGRRAVEAAMKPGAKAKDVFMAGARVLEEAGLCASISCLGHGMGLDCHEKPFITSFSEDTIMEGQTVVIEMYSEVKGIGPILMEDGGVVTAEGWKCFSDIPVDIVEVR